VQAKSGPELPAVLPPAVQVFALGGFKVLVRGQVLPEQAWRRKSARQLFKILLSRPSRRLTRDEVTELLWPESDPDATSSNFRSTLFALRHALEPPPEAAGMAVVFSDRDGVWLRPDVELWVDADAFEHTVEQAWRSTDPLPLLEQASALYAGDYLPEDLYEDWATERREALKRNWTELQFGLAQAYETRADVHAAAHPLERLLSADPCDERAAQELMRLLARHSRRADALRVYQRLSQALHQELDVEPSSQSVELHRQITAGESALPPRTSAAAFRCAYPFPAPTEFIGRESELTVLSKVLANGRTAGQAAFLGAPAGTGKSALLGRIVQQAQAQGVLCLAGGCYENRGAVPLGPFHDALVDFLLAQSADRIRADLGSTADDLAQVVPELRYHLKLPDRSTSSPPAIDRMRAFGAIHAYLRGLAEQSPVLVCLEDLHAADEATVQLFHYLARQTRRLPLVLIATYRTDEAPADGPLAQTAATMARERIAQRVVLGAFGRDETDRLATALLDGSPSQDLSQSLYATTGGNALFVEQLLLALGEAGYLQQRAGVWHGTAELQGTPQIVREVIAQRLHRLPQSCREVLAMAAVLGQSFEYKVLLAAVEGTDERSLLGDLDRAISAHVVQETPAGYAFRHGLVREAVYWELSAPRRMLLHGRAGELLERFRGERANDYAAELAHHFILAGQSDSVRSKALRYSLQAGKRAAALSSYPESLAHFTHAWDIVETDGGLSGLDIRLSVLDGRGWAEANLARHLESVTSYRQVLALSQDAIQRGRARKVIAFSLDHTGAYHDLIEECEAGLAEVADVTGPEAIEIRATLLQIVGLRLYRQGRFTEVLRLGQRIEAEAANAGPGPRMLAHKVIGWGYAGQGQVEQAIQQYELAIAEAERWGDKPSLATSYGILGQLDYLGGRFAAARDHLARSLALYRESATELRAAFPLNMLCRLWLAEGEHVRASAQIVQALQLETEGQEPVAADAHQILGDIRVLHGEWERAAESFRQALALFSRAEETARIVETTVALGFVNQCVGRWDRAQKYYADAVKISEGMDPSPQRVLALRHLGRLHLIAGDRVAAAAEIGGALALSETMSETLEHAPTLRVMAELFASRDQSDQALKMAMQSLDQTQSVEQLAEVHVVLAQIQQTRGDSSAAERHASEAVAQASRLGSPRLLCRAYLVLAQAQVVEDAARASLTFHVALQQTEEAATPYERTLVLTAYADCLRQMGSSLDLAASMEAEALQIAEDLALTLSDQVRTHRIQLLPATT
jgi:DNA-binding SARP family transcriptional activator